MIFEILILRHFPAKLESCIFFTNYFSHSLILHCVKILSKTSRWWFIYWSDYYYVLFARRRLSLQSAVFEMVSNYVALPPLFIILDSSRWIKYSFVVNKISLTKRTHRRLITHVIRARENYFILQNYFITTPAGPVEEAQGKRSRDN